MKAVALLRGINVGGARKVPMAELREVAAGAGFTEVATYIQSGNLVLEAGKLGAEQVAGKLERAIEDRFGFSVDVIVRTANRFRQYEKENPFPDAARQRPNLLLLGLATRPIPVAAARSLAERTNQGERIRVVKGALWIDFVKSVGQSKLTPAVLDRTAGSTVTARNWRTVLKIGEMLEG